MYGRALDVAEASSAIDDRQYAATVVRLAEQVIRDGGELVRVRADLPQVVRAVARGRHADLAARAAVITCLQDMFEGRRFDKAPIDSAIASFRGSGDLAGEARAWWALSLVHREVGEVVASGEAATRSLECARRAEDRALASQALQSLAFSLLFGPFHAKDVIPRLRRLREDAGADTTEAIVLGCLGHAEAIAGNYFEARLAAERSREILVSMQQTLDVARLDVFNRSEIERWAGDLTSAERIARGGCQVMERHRAVGLLASAFCFLAEILIAEGRPDEAHEVVARAAIHLTEADVDARWRQARARARIELSADHIAFAEDLARIALDLVQTTQVPHENSDVYFVLAQVHLAGGRDRAAVEAATQSLALAQQKGHVAYATRAREMLAALDPANAT